MDQDFPTSPSKRRRTESPPTEPVQDASRPSIPGLTLSEPSSTNHDTSEVKNETTDRPVHVEEMPRDIQSDNGPDLLNMLMAQVEAQARDHGNNLQVEPVVQHVTEWKQQEDHSGSREKSVPLLESDDKTTTSGPGTADVENNDAPEAYIPQAFKNARRSEVAAPDADFGMYPPFNRNDSYASAEEERQGTATPFPDNIDLERELHDHYSQADQTHHVPTDPVPTSEAVVAPPAGKEWETDSSPCSSSTDTSSDSDLEQDSDDEGDNDYALLSPTEQARILMDDAGSDDEGKSKATGGALRTTNEKVEEVIPKPDILVTPDMRVEDLGSVEAVVESTVLIKGKTTGEYQVLESGSLLCLEDKSVIGVVADTMGRVEQPLYTVRFTNDAAIAEAGVAVKGTPICYVYEHSRFVFTQPLKGLKGTDASNFHDEEVGDEELEFSDDEKEAEHRRRLKLRKRGIDVDTMGDRGGRAGARGGMQGRGGRGSARGRGRGGFQPAMPTHPENNMAGATDAMSLNYDDGEVTEYEPLRRPSTMESQEAPQQNGYQPPAQQQSEYMPPRYQPSDNRRGGHQRGRGQNNRGRGSRGNFQQNRNQYQSNQQENNYQQVQSQSYGFHQPQQQSWLPPVPPPPGMPNFFNPGMAPGNTSFNFGHQQNGYGQSVVPPTDGQQKYAQQSSYGQQDQGYGGAWATNQAAAEQVQQQLEQLRRQAQEGPNYR